MRPTSKTYETRLPSSRNQRANLDVSGRVEATMSSSVFSDWLCKTRPRKNKHMTHVTVCCSNFNAQNDWSFLFQIGKIAEFIPEQLCLAQFHPSIMKVSIQYLNYPNWPYYIHLLMWHAMLARHVTARSP